MGRTVEKYAISHNAQELWHDVQWIMSSLEPKTGVINANMYSNIELVPCYFSQLHFFFFILLILVGGYT